MSQSNYEIMKVQMQKEFLKYDQQTMIQKFQLYHDEEYLYIRFIGRDYRINRFSGVVEWSENQWKTCHAADYNEVMTIYDVLCYSKENCRLSGNFTPVNGLKSVVKTSKNSTGGSLFRSMEQYFDQNFQGLKNACEKLGGKPEKIGDLSYRLLLFDFLPVILQFWQSDDEFPACLKLMWDENVLDFMHYETTWFAASHLWKRLKEEMEGHAV